MTKVFGSTALLCLVALPVMAQADWRQRLKTDVVVIRDGKMVYDEVGLYHVKVPGYQPAQYQVKIHAEAPQGGLVSRDNFVSMTALMFTTVFTTALAAGYRVTAGQFLEAVDYNQLSSTIGTPDMELNLVMTNDGMQLEVVNTASGQRSRQTQTWEQMFAQ